MSDDETGPVPFVVVDLGSQARAVAELAAGWTKSTLLAWLAESGSIEPVPQATDECYLWVGPTGLYTNLYFPDSATAVIHERTGSGLRTVSLPLTPAEVEDN